MKVAIHQPNYAPWCGYFAKMKHCDVFIFLDDVQMPGGSSYVSRVQVWGENGPQWLSLPVSRTLGDPISAVTLAQGQPWKRKHLGRLEAVYRRAPRYAEVMEVVGPVYEAAGPLLAELNVALIRAVARYLGLGCEMRCSSEMPHQGESDERLVSLVQAAGGTTYLSGKGGQNYQDPARFAAHGIGVAVMEYRPVPYAHHTGTFLPGLSILDALFNLGREAADVLVYPHDAR